jgi:hypothetical protein
MLLIQCNNKEIDINTESLRTVSELIPSFKDNHLGQGEYLSSLAINGEHIQNFNQNTILNKPLSEIQHIELRTSNSKSILLETIDDLPKYIDQLLGTINLAVKFSENDQYKLTETLLLEIIGKIDAFIQLITHIHQSLSVVSDERLKSGQTIKQLEIHLLSVVKAILVAQKREDQVMLIDLLDYELKDNLTQWKIVAIPQIKKLNTI